MANEGPILIGIDGIIAGEEYPLEYGQTFLVGRSRSCDISLRNCQRWILMSLAQRKEEQDFKTVSRKHLRISFLNSNSIELEDLSSNGTFVDGNRIGRIVIADLQENDHEVLLGSKERLKLCWK